MKGFFMSYRDHNSKLVAIAWITNDQGVRVGSWKKEIREVMKNKYEADYIALELLFNAIIHCRINNIEIVSFNLRLHQQLTSTKKTNSYLSIYQKRIRESIKCLKSIGFTYEKVS